MTTAWFANLQFIDDRYTKRQQDIIQGKGKAPSPRELEKLIDKTFELRHGAVREALFEKYNM